MFAHRSARATIVLGLTFLLGCTAAPESFDRLPFPTDRKVTVLSDLTLDGKDAQQRSAGASDMGTSLYLASSGGNSEWAVYQFTPPPMATLSGAQVNFTPAWIDEAWVAVANFSTQRWDFFGPYAASQAVATDTASNLSPNGNVFLAVLSSGGRFSRVETVSLTIDANAPPVASFTATPQNGDPGDPVALDANASSDPDGSIVKYEWDLDDDSVFENDSTPLASVMTSLPSPAGSVTVHLRVTDDDGAIDTQSLALTSYDPSPVAPVTVDNNNAVNGRTSMAIINGNPAIAYQDYANKNLMYVRATDPIGSSWGSEQNLDQANEVGDWSSVAEVNGAPAVAYYDATTKDVMYIRAVDANGDNWGGPMSIDGTNDTGRYAMLAVVEGNPAIAYVDDSVEKLQYVRAVDANGDTWEPPMTVDTATINLHELCLTVINGNPAMSYGNNTELRYIRSPDAQGDTWGAPATVSTGVNVQNHCFLIVANGNPAIGFSYLINPPDYGTRFVRADDANGDTWGQPQDVIPLGSEQVKFAIIRGRPAFSYVNAAAGNDLYYMEALDSSGSSWGAGQLVDDSPVNCGRGSFLHEVAGGPAISYIQVSQSDLMYAKVY